MKILTCLLLLASVAAAAERQFPTTMPSRVGDERFVRAMYRKQAERTMLQGTVKVLAIDGAGNETAGLLTIEKLVRATDRSVKELAPFGQRIVLKRITGRIQFFHEDDQPLDNEVARPLSLVSGLRGGEDDLDFWQRPAGTTEDWPVNEARLRKIIATADFDMATVESTTRVADGEISARLRIGQMVGKPSATFKDGTFDIACRWRVSEHGLERYRHTHWVLRDRGESGAKREVEIIGIESRTPATGWTFDGH